MIPLDAHLLAAVLEEPESDALRLVCADFWEEHGEVERAEFIRVQVELAQMEARHHHECTSTVKRGMEAAGLRRRERELLTLSVEQRWPDYAPAIPCWLNADSTVTVHREATAKSVYSSTVAFRRGFIAAITCTAADWLAHADAIRAREPVTEVMLTTWPEVQHDMINSAGDIFANTQLAVRLVGQGRWKTITNKCVMQQTWEQMRPDVIKELLAAEWPGITFTLPPDAGGLLVPPMFDNALLLSALQNGDAIPSTLTPTWEHTPSKLV